jgi:hypothetical protein
MGKRIKAELASEQEMSIIRGIKELTPRITDDEQQTINHGRYEVGCKGGVLTGV